MRRADIIGAIADDVRSQMERRLNECSYADLRRMQSEEISYETEAVGIEYVVCLVGGHIVGGMIYDREGWPRPRLTEYLQEHFPDLSGMIEATEEETMERARYYADLPEYE